jgi:hypothetical protein
MTPPNRSGDVDAYLATFEHPMKDDVVRLRDAILASNARVTERIKWKAPSFCVYGDDRVTFRFPPRGGIQLIFHRGVKVKDAAGFRFDDDTGLMEWAAPDRAVVRLADSADVQRKEDRIVALVTRWMDATGGPAGGEPQ